MRILAFFLILIIYYSCSNNKSSNLKIKINEVAFFEDNNTKLEYIEIYNPHNFKIHIDSIYLSINKKKHIINNLDHIEAGQIIFKKIDAIINNTEFKII